MSTPLIKQLIELPVKVAADLTGDEFLEMQEPGGGPGSSKKVSLHDFIYRFGDAPNDGTPYARRSRAWYPIVTIVINGQTPDPVTGVVTVSAAQVPYSGVASGLAATTAQEAIDKVVAQSIVVACSDEVTALTAGTGKVTFRNPYTVPFIIMHVKASLTTAQISGGIVTVDLNKSGVSILSTKITVDNTQKTSETAAIAPVVSDTSIAGDAEISVDVDQIGDGTAKGLKIYLVGHT